MCWPGGEESLERHHPHLNYVPGSEALDDDEIVFAVDQPFIIIMLRLLTYCTLSLITVPELILRHKNIFPPEEGLAFED
ncbi:hypothetical protein Tco_0795422 [Tanacetum coccineum]